MTINTVYIFERGILGWQSITGAWQWPHSACAWINKNTPCKAQTITYFCGFIFPALTRHYRAKQFARLMRQYQVEGWRTVLVAHSEGTATALRALKMLGPAAYVDEVHLICGACNSDFKANGLNHAIAIGTVGNVFVYVAEKDRAMRLEDTYIGSACFGLECAGTPLGLNGPVNQTPLSFEKTEVRRWHNYGHSTCWRPQHFELTMSMIRISTDKTYVEK